MRSLKSNVNNNKEKKKEMKKEKKKKQIMGWDWADWIDLA